MQDHLRAALADAADLIEWIRADGPTQDTMLAVADAMASCLRADGRILSCGNGGSMCDAMHFAEELTGRFHDDRPALSAMAISDPSHLTCVANDFGFERIFARGVEAWGRPGDVLVVLSTSGNSPNVLAAARAARDRGMAVVGMLGGDGGKMRELCDHQVIVPAHRSDRIQEIHIKVLHILIELIERKLHPENYSS